MKFFIINDFVDINDIPIRHFSLDKGYFIAKSLVKLGHIVYFLTTKPGYVKDEIKFIHPSDITQQFVLDIDYIIIVREPLFVDILRYLPNIKIALDIPKQVRIKPKFIVKSDSPTWFTSKLFIKQMASIYGHKKRTALKKWIISHVDFICAQNELFANYAYQNGIPKKSLIITNMSIENKQIDFSLLSNPYDINHTYCVASAASLIDGKALWPQYYVKNPSEKQVTNTKKYIIVYTGRIKTDSGKILYNMRNIMNILGDMFELHIFPGSFYIPNSTGHIICSAKNSKALELLRDTIFPDSKNVFIHYPYLHKNKYAYLNYADCGIDFSDARPTQNIPFAGHAKILEYCEMGLPVVCEETIQNLFLIKNGKNGIILPYMASDNDYAEAIKSIVSMQIDRQYCRNITLHNENWDTRVKNLLDDLDKLNV